MRFSMCGWPSGPKPMDTMPSRNPAASQPALVPVGLNCSGCNAAKIGAKPPSSTSTAMGRIRAATNITTACRESVMLTAQKPPRHVYTRMMAAPMTMAAVALMSNEAARVVPAP